MPTSVPGSSRGRPVPARAALRGFTLLELLVVIAIVALSAGVVSLALRDGDVFMLCSDGLWEAVEEPTMERLLAGSTSAVSSGTGCRPPDFSISVNAGLPAQVNILVFFKSSGVTIGFLEKNRTQPVSPQNRTTNPAFSIRLVNMGRSRSLT